MADPAEIFYAMTVIGGPIVLAILLGYSMYCWRRSRRGRRGPRDEREGRTP